MGEEEARVRRWEAVKEDWKGTRLSSREVVAEGDGRTGFDRCLGVGSHQSRCSWDRDLGQTWCGEKVATVCTQEEWSAYCVVRPTKTPPPRSKETKVKVSESVDRELLQMTKLLPFKTLFMRANIVNMFPAFGKVWSTLPNNLSLSFYSFTFLLSQKSNL